MTGTERRTDGLTDGGRTDSSMVGWTEGWTAMGGRERQTDGSTDECLMQSRPE